MTSASDGAEALRLLRSSAPDTFQLVLTVSGLGCLPNSGVVPPACRLSRWSQQPVASQCTCCCLSLPQDVCMPEVNGIELLSQVKADANLRAVPVVSECGARHWVLAALRAL